jgi:hypothetical protein
MKKLLLALFAFGLLLAPISSFAQTSNDFEIIPKATDQTTVDKAVTDVGSK